MYLPVFTKHSKIFIFILAYNRLNEYIVFVLFAKITSKGIAMNIKNLSLSCKALSEETRILCLGLMLKAGELCVCDFVEVLGISQSKASRHLRYLLNAGLVEGRREGLWVHYKICSNLNNMQQVLLDSVSVLLLKEPFSSLLIKLKNWQAEKKCKE